MSEKTAQQTIPEAIPEPPAYAPAQAQAPSHPPQDIQYAPQPNYNYNAPPPQVNGVSPIPIPSTQNPIGVESLRTKPDVVICQHCNCKVVTATSPENGSCTYLSCVGLAVIGLTFFCCFIPFCVKACKDIVHTCPNCKRDIALYSRLNKRSQRI